jgi:MFS family permease
MNDQAINLRRSWTVIGVIFAQWLIGYFDKTAMSVVAVPVAKEFGFTPSQMGMVLSGFFVGFAIMVPVGGYLADRFGPRRVLLSVMVLWSLFTGLTAVAWSLGSLIVIRAIFGAAEGSFPAASSAAVAELMPHNKRGRAKGLLQSGASLGTAIGAFAVASIASAYGWRASFLVFAVIGVLLSILFLVVSRDMRCTQRSAANRAAGVPLSALFGSRLVLLLAGIQFGVGFYAWGLTQWMPSYWVNVKGLSLSTAGVATAVPNLIAFVAMIGTGFLADRTSGKEGKFVSLMMLISVVAVTLTYYASTVLMGVIWLGVAQIAIGCCVPMLAIVVLKRMDVSVVGTATGLSNLGQQIAGVVAPTVMGVAIQLSGGSYAAVFALVVAILLLCASISLLLDRTSAGKLAPTAA